MIHRVFDLVGPRLDAAVAKAQRVASEPDVNLDLGLDDDALPPLAPEDEFRPSTNWAQGGAIIDSERISVVFEGDVDGWYAGYEMGTTTDFAFFSSRGQQGPTALVAAMRAFVVKRLGEEIELP
jgi:hypothetical protein